MGRCLSSRHRRSRSHFRKDAKHQPPARLQIRQQSKPASSSTILPAATEAAEVRFQRFCSGCHGDVAVSGGVLPDLRYSGTLDNDQWFDIVLKGQLKQAGMVSFDKELSHDDAAAIPAYVIFPANKSLPQTTSPPK